MRPNGRRLASFGWRGMLALVGGVASLAGLGTSACAPVYGPAPGDGGWTGCATNADCEVRYGSGWYCEDHLTCQPPPGVPVQDGGTSDAGK